MLGFWVLICQVFLTMPNYKLCFRSGFYIIRMSSISLSKRLQKVNTLRDYMDCLQATCNCEDVLDIQIWEKYFEAATSMMYDLNSSPWRSCELFRALS
jgi:hypothetical protein